MKSENLFELFFLIKKIQYNWYACCIQVQQLLWPPTCKCRKGNVFFRSIESVKSTKYYSNMCFYYFQPTITPICKYVLTIIVSNKSTIAVQELHTEGCHGKLWRQEYSCLDPRRLFPMGDTMHVSYVKLSRSMNNFFLWHNYSRLKKISSWHWSFYVGVLGY